MATIVEKHSQRATNDSSVTVVTNDSVTHANREVYNRKTIDSYDGNESIFSEKQTERLTSIVRSLQRRTMGTRFLDIGCGTGNMLRIAENLFANAYGIDVADQLLAQVRERWGFEQLAAARADALPFADDSLDVVSMYAVLHHLLDPAFALKEAYRVLKPGGVLFTDHDPNHYFGRIYHPLKRWLLSSRRDSFGTDLEDLAEYHHTRTTGLDPEGLKRTLTDIGFSKVRVTYRPSTNESLAGREAWAMRVLRVGSTLTRLRSFYTHFMLVAEK